MYLTKVAPLSRIPRPSSQVLSYFTQHNLKRGALITIPLRKKNVKAIVLSQENAVLKKMEIKKSDFELKPILKIKSEDAILNNYQLELAEWISDYYWASLGKTLSLFLNQSKKQKIIENLSIKKSISQKRELIMAKLGYFPEKEIKENIKKGKEVLFLVPETQKTIFWKEKLKKYDSPLLHIGTRSLLFRPFENLGLIVITEEENKNYKSEMEPKYNSKRVAKKLAEIWNAKLVLVSSFPSVESYYEAMNNDQQKTNDKKMITVISYKPSVLSQIVDMRKIKPWKPISSILESEVKKNVNSGKKTILFINRRGTATTLLCQDCGWVQKCKNCDAPMVYYFENNKNPMMICHYCGEKKLPLRLCEECKSWNLTTLGVGIQKIENELKKQFPKEKILRLDSQSTKKREEESKILKKFLEKEYSLLITTSLIFKYLPIKKVPLVGVVSIDSMLSLPDFNIEEECTQLIEKLLSICKEKFIFQTFFPDSEVISWIKNNKETFFERKIKERRTFSYPPFSSLIKLSFSHPNQIKARNESYLLKRNIEKEIFKEKMPAEIIGPSPAFIEKIGSKYNWKLLIKLKTENQKIKNEILTNVPPSWRVDVDPIDII